MEGPAQCSLSDGSLLKANFQNGRLHGRVEWKTALQSFSGVFRGGVPKEGEIQVHDMKAVLLQIDR